MSASTEGSSGPAQPGWAARLRMRASVSAQPEANSGDSAAISTAISAATARASARIATVVHAQHEGPLRLLKPLYPEGSAVAHAVLVHPPGGLVGGDRLDIELDVQAGAHLLISTPSATRFYRSKGLEQVGQAVQHVRASVQAGACLEWLPQETLAYSGCQGLNAWSVQLQGNAKLLAMELTVLGLSQAGKPFEQGCFTQEMQVPGLWLERAILDARDEALLNGPCGLAGKRVLGSLVFACGERLEPSQVEALLQAARDGIADVEQTLAGATCLREQVLVVRVLSDHLEPAQQLLRSIWAAWRPLALGLPAVPPRIWAS